MTQQVPHSLQDSLHAAQMESLNTVQKHRHCINKALLCCSTSEGNYLNKGAAKF